MSTDAPARPESPPQPGARQPRWDRIAGAIVVLVVLVTAFVVGLVSLLGEDDQTPSVGAVELRDARVTPIVPKPATATAPTAGSPSRPDLRPPAPVVRRNEAGQASGLVFIAPKVVFGAERTKGQQDGPMILDSQGRVRWFAPTDGADDVYDFRRSSYEGKPVLTYWLGRAVGGSGHGKCVVQDASYRVLARVDFKGPADADIHECRLTDRGTMLMIGYETVPADTSAFKGGSKDGKVTEGVVKEIDVASNRVKLEWRSLEDGVPLSDTYERVDGHTGPGFDYIHLNSVAEDSDGDLVVSGRHTWTEYKIDRSTGKLVWKLGGKDSDFVMGAGTQTGWQHDAVPIGDGVIRTFDNGKGTDGGEVLRPYSRITWVKVDPSTRTATLVRSIMHPQDVSAGTQGSAEGVPGGGTFVGWGSAGVYSEFGADGSLLLDAKLPQSYDSYRAYRDTWKATPTSRPAVTATEADGGGVEVHASWNGSTEVERWQVLAADSRDGRLRPVGRAFAWNGLDTGARLSVAPAYVAVRALDASGRMLAESRRVAVG